MQDTVLIVAPAEDAHGRAVAIALERDFDTAAVIWDNSGFPAKSAVSLMLADGGLNCKIQLPDGRKVPMASLRSVWWRRSGMYKIDQSVIDPEVRQFCSKECDTSFKGTLEVLGVPIVNALAAETSAGRKPLQLRMAVKAGVRIPKTLMSNDPDEVVAFWESVNHSCIYKAFTPPLGLLAETRMLVQEDLGHLEKLRHAPIIVQEKIEKGRDVRVSIFGQRVFAAEVTTYRAEAELDWRLDLTATWAEHCLPDDISRNLVNLLRMLGLHYGCIDLRQRPDGQYVFLEVNPSGQFLFVEVDTGQPLLRAMAELLLAPMTVSAVPPDIDSWACAPFLKQHSTELSKAS